ncbi:hypothetical protein PO148_07230 [Limosilactobacillus mucosae]|uniref:Uncharacterized protein n=1 Tax=Limosilactobacillus mucosae TaxID=97478 RepID=A0AAJ1HVJ8_LIMMU|nr:hypothetical protein [Limosilactobacillus mucosae]MDC2830181.1 hypothetical protein [Limosilactobacillus mucosae]MDC2837752.1 hypothetical protein [Limosilactobacillus mucosae]MDC2849769.1 hypothetical protein [Limosilactobacillus mucosae]MDC2853905.1 hypothetical protein [Limosilactobacillus mucosae]
MHFIGVDVVSDNGKERVYKIESDIEVATLILNKDSLTTSINGFTDTLKYLMSKKFIDDLIINSYKKNPEQKSFTYGRG